MSSQILQQAKFALNDFHRYVFNSRNAYEQQKQITFANLYGANDLQIRFCKYCGEAECRQVVAYEQANEREYLDYNTEGPDHQASDYGHLKRRALPNRLL